MAYLEEPEEKYDEIIPISTGIKKKTVRVYFSKHSNKYKDLMEFKTYRINIPVFLDELLQECKKLGV